MRPLDEPYILLGGFGGRDEEAILLGRLFGIFEGEGGVGVQIDEIIVAMRVNHNITYNQKGVRIGNVSV